MGGYRFHINRDLDLEPGGLFKTTENWNPQGDVSLRLYYLMDFWAGISYRTNNSLIGMVGVRFDNIFFGYSFDWNFSDIGNYNYGSHEITLSVKMGHPLLILLKHIGDIGRRNPVDFPRGVVSYIPQQES